MILPAISLKDTDFPSYVLYHYTFVVCHLPSFSHVQFSSVRSLSRVWRLATPWTAARQASLPITNSRSLLKLLSTESVMPANHLILCHTLLLPPSIFPSIKVFSDGSVLHTRRPKYWSVSFSIRSLNIQDWFPWGWTSWVSLQSKGLSKSSPTPQFKSINCSLFSFLYSPNLISIHHYWKNHSFD